MAYYINLRNISLVKYRTIITFADLVPSRMILKENTTTYFKAVEETGVANLEDLKTVIGTKKKLQKYARENQIDENYLTILIREVKSMQPKPIQIKDFPSVSNEIASKLENIGIKNSLQLYDRIITFENRQMLAYELNINEQEVLKLSCLTDLVRIRWVNHTFAAMLYEVNYNTAQKVASADYHQLHELVNDLNKKKNYYRGSIGLHDFKLVVVSAGDLDFDIVL